MARGKSGRIVVEIDVSTKNALYSALAMDGLTLREWFLQRAREYVELSRQPVLFGKLPASAEPETAETPGEKRRELKP
jgi:hypothetical protein